MTSTDNGNVYYSEIAVGIDLLWNNKLDKAEEYFGKLKDTNPRYALHFAEVKITPQIWFSSMWAFLNLFEIPVSKINIKQIFLTQIL